MVNLSVHKSLQKALGERKVPDLPKDAAPLAGKLAWVGGEAPDDGAIRRLAAELCRF